MYNSWTLGLKQVEIYIMFPSMLVMVGFMFGSYFLRGVCWTKEKDTASVQKDIELALDVIRISKMAIGDAKMIINGGFRQIAGMCQGDRRHVAVKFLNFDWF